MPNRRIDIGYRESKSVFMGSSSPHIEPTSSHWQIKGAEAKYSITTLHKGDLEFGIEGLNHAVAINYIDCLLDSHSPCEELLVKLRRISGTHIEVVTTRSTYYLYLVTYPDSTYEAQIRNSDGKVVTNFVSISSFNESLPIVLGKLFGRHSIAFSPLEVIGFLDKEGYGQATSFELLTRSAQHCYIARDNLSGEWLAHIKNIHNGFTAPPTPLASLTKYPKKARVGIPTTEPFFQPDHHKPSKVVPVNTTKTLPQMTFSAIEMGMASAVLEKGTEAFLDRVGLDPTNKIFVQLAKPALPLLVKHLVIPAVGESLPGKEFIERRCDAAFKGCLVTASKDTVTSLMEFLGPALASLASDPGALASALSASEEAFEREYAASKETISLE